jgi:hypothetical protein
LIFVRTAFAVSPEIIMSFGTPTILIAVMLAACTPAYAHASRDVTVEIVDRNGVAFEQFPARTRSGGAAYRAYLQAEQGAPYRIRVRNGSGDRIGVVIAVDGRNIISGARSELTRDEPMYVLSPWGEDEYSGWRTSLDDVHEFFFTDWTGSYAEAFGDRSAKGVIAVAVYREKPEKRELHRRPRMSQDSASGPAEAPASSEKQARAAEPGTGFGDHRHEPAVRVAFEAERRPSSRVFLKYEWRETLCTKRIVDCRREPNRFWDEDLAFAPYPPRSWR